MRMTPAQNFGCSYQKSNTAITTTATGAVQIAPNTLGADVWLVNNGTVGVQVAFGGSGVVAVNTAAAGGTSQVYMAAGASRIVSLGENQYFSAITDSGTGSLILMVGAGF